MLKPVQAPSKHGPPLIPDDLLMVDEADPEQTVQYFAGELGCVPNVARLKTGYEFESLGPVSSGVSRDGGFMVSLGAFFHIARLRGSSCHSVPRGRAIRSRVRCRRADR